MPPSELRLLRTSERKDFKRCPQRWWWAWVEGLHPRGMPAMPLWFGQGMHIALAEWYVPGVARGRDMRETWTEFIASEQARIKKEYRDQYNEMEEAFADALVLGIAMLTGYYNEYGNDEQWEVIAPEQTFSASFYPSKNIGRAYKGTFDGVIRDHSDGLIKLLEHKNQARIDWVAHLSIDDQAGAYRVVATTVLRRMGLIGPKEEIDGIVYNLLRKGTPDGRPKDAKGFATNKPIKADYVAAIMGRVSSHTERELLKLKVAELEAFATNLKLRVLGRRSETQPTPLFNRLYVDRTRRERNAQIASINAEITAMDRFLTGEQKVYTNPTYACPNDCAFFQLCELKKSAEDWRSFIPTILKTRDPYADHRKSITE